jgi:hypothetical protein
MPAPAITTSIPSCSAVARNFVSRAGVRWAEITRASLAMPSSSSIFSAAFMISQSLWLPMMIATRARGFAIAFPPESSAAV